MRATSHAQLSAQSTCFILKNVQIRNTPTVKIKPTGSCSEPFINNNIHSSTKSFTVCCWRRKHFNIYFPVPLSLSQKLILPDKKCLVRLCWCLFIWSARRFKKKQTSKSSSCGRALLPLILWHTHRSDYMRAGWRGGGERSLRNDSLRSF